MPNRKKANNCNKCSKRKTCRLLKNNLDHLCIFKTMGVQPPKQKTIEEIYATPPSLRTDDDYRILCEHVKAETEEIKQRTRTMDFAFTYRKINPGILANDLLIRSSMKEVANISDVCFPVRSGKNFKIRRFKVTKILDFNRRDQLYEGLIWKNKDGEYTQLN